jgi:uncharacterized protein (TIGR03067 family)
MDENTSQVANPVRFSFLRRSKRTWIAVGIVVFGLLLLFTLTSTPRGGAERLQGEWRVVGIEDAGVPVVEPFQQTRQYVFSGHTFINRKRGASSSFWTDRLFQKFTGASFRIDHSTNPSHLDLSLPNGVTMKGIYEFEGDRLRICFPHPTKPWDRPTQFSDRQKSNRLLILERDQPSK